MMMFHSSNEDSLDVLNSIIITILVITCCLGYGATVIVGQSYESNVVKSISCVPLLQMYVTIDYLVNRSGAGTANVAAVVGVAAIPFYCILIFAITIRVLMMRELEEGVEEDDRPVEA
jgi:ACR3 family arsenite efflux pump ArsB